MPSSWHAPCNMLTTVAVCFSASLLSCALHAAACARRITASMPQPCGQLTLYTLYPEGTCMPAQKSQLPVQTMEGKPPQGVTSSEMAALFDLHILPELRKRYPADQEQFDAQRQAFAAEIGEPDRWRELRLPSYVSLDSAPYHPWVRQKLSVPRLTKDQQAAHVREQLRQKTGNAVPDDWMPPDAWMQWRQTAPPQAEFTSTMVTRTQAMLQSGQPRQHWHADPGSEPDDDAALATAAPSAAPAPAPAPVPEWLQSDETAALVRAIVLELQRTNSDMQLLFPKQFMPLMQVTPDIHSPIEHCVAKVKSYIKQCIRENLTSEMLFQAQTYVDWVTDFVRDKLQRQPGHKYLLSAEQSIKKQKCICEILAADKTEVVTVWFEFGRNKRLKAGKLALGDSAHHVRGSAGEWVRDNRFT